MRSKMPESGFARSVFDDRPLAALSKKLNRKQKRLLTIGVSAVVVGAAGTWAYFYIAGAPERAQQQFQGAMRFMEPGHYQQAIAQLTRAIKTYEVPAAYVERGAAYRVLGQNDAAAADFERAAALDPSQVRAYSGLGNIYRDRGDTRRAIEAYSKSISVSLNADALFERGALYEKLGEHQKAIDDLTAAIHLIPDAPYIYRARAMAESSIGDEAAAQQDRSFAFSIERPAPE